MAVKTGPSDHGTQLRAIICLFDAKAVDNEGGRLGAVRNVYVDEASGYPTFIELTRGMLGVGRIIVPLRGASFQGKQVRLGFTKRQMRGAPSPQTDVLSRTLQYELLQHYGVAQHPPFTGSREAAA